MRAIGESFSEGHSLVHRLDPRGKLAIAAIFAIILAPARSFPAALAGLTLALGWLALANLPVKKVLLRLMAVNGFILFLWLILPWSYPGDPVWHLGPLTATREGIAITALIDSLMFKIMNIHNILLLQSSRGRVNYSPPANEKSECQNIKKTSNFSLFSSLSSSAPKYSGLPLNDPNRFE